MIGARLASAWRAASRQAPPTIRPRAVADEWATVQVVAVLFISFRLLSLILLRPGGYFGGLSDFVYYREFASLSLNGFYPFIHYWMEYPPVLPWLAVLVYQVTVRLPTFGDSSMWFQLGLGSVLALADTANLLLVARIGRRLGSDVWAMRSAIVYAGLFFPVYLLTSGFDGLAVLCLLAMIERAMARSPAAAGAWLALGVLTKIFPLFAAPAVLRYLPTWRSRAVFIGAAAVVGTAIVGPLAVMSPEMVVASATGLFARGSWQSIWAILDGYYGSGLVASLPDRLFYSPSAGWAHPERTGLLWYAIAAPIGVLAVATVLRTADSAATMVRGAALLIAVFLLVSKGFSPQFTIWLLPFVALLMPSVRGALWAAAFTANNVLIEAYVYFFLFPDHRWLLWLTVGARGALLMLFLADAGTPLHGAMGAWWQSLKRKLVMPLALVATALVLVAGARLGPAYVEVAAQRTLSPGLRGAIEVIDRESAPKAVVLFTQGKTLEQVAPFVGGRDVQLLADPKLRERRDEFSARAVLRRLTAGHPEVVLVAQAAQDDGGRADAVRTLLMLEWDAAGTWRSDEVAVERFIPNDRATVDGLLSRNVVFGDSIRLRGFAHPDTARASDIVEVTLHWQALGTIDFDYTTFIHILDAGGGIVVQSDVMPGQGMAPTSGWRPGEAIRDRVTLKLPAELATGEYTVAIGLYNGATGERLPIQGGGEGERLVLGRIDVTGGSGH